MIIDTSAIVACLTGEDGWPRIIEALERADSRSISSMTLLELRIVLSTTRLDSASWGEEFLRRYLIMPVDFTVEHSAAAARAHRRFGRGNHPARLNFGDCASYATAQIANEPLLFVGDDFALTDIRSAL